MHIEVTALLEHIDGHFKILMFAAWIFAAICLIMLESRLMVVSREAKKQHTVRLQAYATTTCTVSYNTQMAALKFENAVTQSPYI